MRVDEGDEEEGEEFVDTEYLFNRPKHTPGGYIGLFQFSHITCKRTI